MLKRLPAALAQVKTSNRPENLLNEIRQIICSLYWAKKITKKVHNSIMNSIKLYNRMDTIFTNSEKSKNSDPHGLLLSFSDKIDLKRSEKYLALLNPSIYYT